MAVFLGPPRATRGEDHSGQLSASHRRPPRTTIRRMPHEGWFEGLPKSRKRRGTGGDHGAQRAPQAITRSGRGAAEVGHFVPQPFRRSLGAGAFLCDDIVEPTATAKFSVTI